jgi:hypothetical protein
VQAELRSLVTNWPDDSESLETFQPDDPELFGLDVTAFIGPKDSPGVDLFKFFVCSPRQLEREPREKGFQTLRSGSGSTRKASRPQTLTFSD